MDNRTKIISVTRSLSRYGGAQKVLMDLHFGLSQQFECKVLGFQAKSALHNKFASLKADYVRFWNPFYLRNKVLIVHSRNLISFFVVLKRLFFLNTKIVYVSHNVYDTHRSLTFFPDHIVSISEKVSENLVDYFRCNKKQIRLIYNGMHDLGYLTRPRSLQDTIKILYPARVNSVKQQLKIIDRLTGRLNSGIEIHFAGTGPDFQKLVEKCRGSENFFALGFIDNIHTIIDQYDFLMLYSVQEGLPLSLIEGIMHSKPLLVNDVGGNLEIGIPGVNAIHLSGEIGEMCSQINLLHGLSPEKYSNMCVKSRQLYLEKFTYTAMVRQYASLINEISTKR